MEKRYFHFPKWMTALYAVSLVVLIPWTFYLADNLPANHVANHWDLAWAGFDFFMIILLLITVITALRRSIWVAVFSTALATMLVIDAWFDVLTARPGHQVKDAILFAVFVEIPLAILTYYFAYRSINNLHRRLQKIKR